jgi:carbamoylphosphate synthase large subunit
LVVSLAQDLGFNVPETVVVGNANAIDWNVHHVTKSISEIYQIIDEQSMSTNFTYSINPSELGQVEQFFPSLLQKRVSKVGDVRLFVFRDLFYASLIVTDNGELDYRQNYNLTSTRFLPYEIDKATQAKVYRLLKKLDLDGGSVDFMLDSKGKLWFLEVNPEGQFGFMEYHCGYDIAKQIALKITEHVS